MAKLTSAERNALPSSDFAEPADRKYPIEDASHARNALSRASQHASPKAKSKIDSKVHNKFPAIGKASVMGDMHGGMHHHHHTTNVHVHMGGKKKFSL